MATETNQSSTRSIVPVRTCSGDECSSARRFVALPPVFGRDLIEHGEFAHATTAWLHRHAVVVFVRPCDFAMMQRHAHERSRAAEPFHRIRPSARQAIRAMWRNTRKVTA